MEYPAGDIGRVLRELCQSNTKAVEHAVDKYFTDDAQLVGTFRVRSRPGRLFTPARCGSGADEVLSWLAILDRAAPLFTTPKQVGKEAVKAAYRVRQGESFSPRWSGVAFRKACTSTTPCSFPADSLRHSLAARHRSRSPVRRL